MESLCCTPETHVTLCVHYISIKKKKGKLLLENFSKGETSSVEESETSYCGHNLSSNKGQKTSS